MKTYYCVRTTFDDRGRVTAAIVDILEADSKPESSKEETPAVDIYLDWFDTQEDAEAFLEEAKEA